MLEAILVGIIDAVLLRKTMQFCSGVDSTESLWRCPLRSRTGEGANPPPGIGHGGAKRLHEDDEPLRPLLLIAGRLVVERFSRARIR